MWKLIIILGLILGIIGYVMSGVNLLVDLGGKSKEADIRQQRSKQKAEMGTKSNSFQDRALKKGDKDCGGSCFDH